MQSRRTLQILLSCFLVAGFSSSAFSKTGLPESEENPSAVCSGGPECVVIAGVLLAMSGMDLRPATAEKMDSIPGSLVVFCKQESSLPEISFPCGPVEVELTFEKHQQILNFRGGKIIIPQMSEEDKPTVVFRARGCKESLTIKDAKPGDVIDVSLSASCTK